MKCKVWTHIPTRDPEYKAGFIDKLIGIKSKIEIDGKTYIATHTEFQFSERKGGLSVSATWQDKCGCVRFKLINYLKHPLRWIPIDIDLTDEQEDYLFRMACSACGLALQTPYTLVWERCHRDGVAHGRKPTRYDTLGVIICNISHRRIIPGFGNRVWCTECVVELLQNLPEFTLRLPLKPDEYRPDTLWRAL